MIPDIDFRQTLQSPSPVLHAAGVKSGSALHEGAELVSLRADDEQIAPSPTVNEGARHGFG